MLGIQSTLCNYFCPPVMMCLWKWTGGWLLLLVSGDWHVVPQICGFPKRFGCALTVRLHASSESACFQAFMLRRGREKCLLLGGCRCNDKNVFAEFSWHFRLSCKHVTLCICMSRIVSAMLGGLSTWCSSSSMGVVLCCSRRCLSFCGVLHERAFSLDAVKSF